MIKRKLGIGCILFGVVLLLGAGTLLIHNHMENQQAQITSQQVLEKITEHIDSTEDHADAEDVTSVPLDTKDDVAADFPIVVIDSNAYVGYLSLPTLALELPVLADTDQSLLQIAPCRYQGTVNGKDLVIGAHNYQSHFGRLTELSIGDLVTFTDMNGARTAYSVVSLEILDPYAVEDLTAGEYPLTLYTCTYGGASRVTVRLDREY